MVVLVAEGLRGRDDDGVTSVDAEGIEVFHIANGDAIVVGVANNLVPVDR